MQYGIKTNPHHTTWEAMLTTWQYADEVGVIDSAWVFDHFYPIFGDTDGPCFEGWVSLSALAQATSRLKVGTMVNGMPYRHPAVTANMAATLDVVSGGRFQLGLGAGWNQLEADAYGITLGDTLTERFDRFDECVEIVVGMLTNEETTFEGKYFSVTNARNEPKGPQTPPPVVIGGSGEKRTLRTVAKWANHWNATPMDAETWAHKVSVLERHCADVGRDPSEIEKSLMLRFNPTEPSGLGEQLRMCGDLGVDTAIINLPSPQSPDHVDIVADVIAKVS
ncbi:MAG: LLM class F420-dependent oxidoreductase [Acidimicrobiia bacterium]|nr:LLM class F420-dependent oxidoreductase [Acidimicrobiia bacterium]